MGLARMIAYVSALARRKHIHAEVDEELRFHLEMEMQANRARGMTPAEARRVALRDLGGVTQTREAVHDVRSTFLDSIRQDVRFAIRGFRRSPGFTFVAVLVLALGIAANTTIFSIINAVLFRPVSVPEARELQFISVRLRQGPDIPHAVPYSSFEEIVRRRDIFGGVAGYLPEFAKIGTGLAATRVAGERVTTDYFDVLHVRAALGRTFVPSDDLAGAASAIIVSDRFWRARLGANPHAVGTTIDLRPLSFHDSYSGYHTPYTIIGVMPPGFSGLSSAWMPAKYWVPLRQRTVDAVAGENAEGMYGGSAEVQLESGGVMIVARLQPGVTDGALRGAVLTAERNMREFRWATARGVRLEKEHLVCAGASRGLLPFDPRRQVVPTRLALALMIVPGMVLLIAAINLAGILMARGVTRRGEIGIRLALGAGRARVARHVLTETILLSLAGAFAALALSRAFIGLFLAYMPSRIGPGPVGLLSISLDVPIDVRVLIFTVALGVAAGILVGLTPALQVLRTDVLAALSGASTGAPATARWRMRRWIVVPQICLSLVLLLAAGVLVRGLLEAEFADRGFNPDRVAYADVALPATPGWQTMTKERWPAENARQTALYMQMLEQVRGLPVVEHAALATKSSWNGDQWGGSSVVTRRSYAAGQNRWVSAGEVSVGYFDTMGIPILRGRAFNEHDTATSTRVAIVCERLAQLLWPHKDPIGEYIANFDPSSGSGKPAWLLVVGLAKEVKVPGREDRWTPFFYVPIEQQARMPEASIVARGRAGSRDLLKTVTEGIVAAHPEAEIPRARTMDEEIGEVLYPRRLGAAILAVSGLFGLLLSTVGLYGVVSYSAAQRLREIGIRAALGAGRRDILALLLRDGLLALGIGVGCGVALGFAAVRVVSGMVVALPALDVLTLVTVPALLSAVILAACLLPAHRAARVNPIDVLRAQ